MSKRMALLGPIYHDPDTDNWMFAVVLGLQGATDATFEGVGASTQGLAIAAREALAAAFEAQDPPRAACAFDEVRDLVEAIEWAWPALAAALSAEAQAG